jgi:hypothetical protein
MLLESRPLWPLATISHYILFSPPSSKQAREERTRENMEKTSSRRIDTTLGDLIAAASEVAFACTDNDKDAYKLAQLALMEMIKKSAHPIDLTEELENLSSPSQLIH